MNAKGEGAWGGYLGIGQWLPEFFQVRGRSCWKKNTIAKIGCEQKSMEDMGYHYGGCPLTQTITGL